MALDQISHKHKATILDELSVPSFDAWVANFQAAWDQTPFRAYVFNRDIKKLEDDGSRQLTPDEIKEMAKEDGIEIHNIPDKGFNLTQYGYKKVLIEKQLAAQQLVQSANTGVLGHLIPSIVAEVFDPVNVAIGAVTGSLYTRILGRAMTIGQHLRMGAVEGLVAEAAVAYPRYQSLTEIGYERDWKDVRDDLFFGMVAGGLFQGVFGGLGGFLGTKKKKGRQRPKEGPPPLDVKDVPPPLDDLPPPLNFKDVPPPLDDLPPPLDVRDIPPPPPPDVKAGPPIKYTPPGFKDGPTLKYKPAGSGPAVLALANNNVWSKTATWLGRGLKYVRNKKVFSLEGKNFQFIRDINYGVDTALKEFDLSLPRLNTAQIANKLESFNLQIRDKATYLLKHVNTMRRNMPGIKALAKTDTYKMADQLLAMNTSDRDSFKKLLYSFKNNARLNNWDMDLKWLDDMVDVYNRNDFDVTYGGDPQKLVNDVIKVQELARDILTKDDALKDADMFLRNAINHTDILENALTGPRDIDSEYARSPLNLSKHYLDDTSLDLKFDSPLSKKYYRPVAMAVQVDRFLRETLDKVKGELIPDKRTIKELKYLLMRKIDILENLGTEIPIYTPQGDSIRDIGAYLDQGGLVFFGSKKLGRMHLLKSKIVKVSQLKRSELSKYPNYKQVLDWIEVQKNKKEIATPTSELRIMYGVDTEGNGHWFAEHPRDSGMNLLSFEGGKGKLLDAKVQIKRGGIFNFPVEQVNTPESRLRKLWDKLSPKWQQKYITSMGMQSLANNKIDLSAIDQKFLVNSHQQHAEIREARLEAQRDLSINDPDFKEKAEIIERLRLKEKEFAQFMEGHQLTGYIKEETTLFSDLGVEAKDRWQYLEKALNNGYALKYKNYTIVAVGRTTVENGHLPAARTASGIFIPLSKLKGDKLRVVKPIEVGELNVKEGDELSTMYSKKDQNFLNEVAEENISKIEQEVKATQNTDPIKIVEEEIKEVKAQLKSDSADPGRFDAELDRLQKLRNKELKQLEAAEKATACAVKKG